MSISRGHPDITVGIIDGPVDFIHPAFETSKIHTIKDWQLSACKNASSIACVHGTFVTGMLCAKRGLSAPAICPDCKVIVNPIFREEMNNPKNEMITPTIIPEELAGAIIETVDAGAQVINLSLGLSTSLLTVCDRLRQAYDYALHKGTIIVVAAGNQGTIGNISLFNHQWPIPVAACDENNNLGPMSNFGSSIGKRGLMAPGINIRSTSPKGQYTYMSGTSFATPFVTGSIALLWSIFRNAKPEEIITSIRQGTSLNRHSVIPPLLDVKTTWNKLKNSY
jgi:subtilisin family serine protease